MRVCMHTLVVLGAVRFADACACARACVCVRVCVCVRDDDGDLHALLRHNCLLLPFARLLLQLAVCCAHALLHYNCLLLPLFFPNHMSAASACCLPCQLSQPGVCSSSLQRQLSVCRVSSINLAFALHRSICPVCRVSQLAVCDATAFGLSWQWLLMLCHRE